MRSIAVFGAAVLLGSCAGTGVRVDPTPRAPGAATTTPATLPPSTVVPTPSTSSPSERFVVGGVRPVIVLTPGGASTPRGLLVVLHGYGGNAAEVIARDLLIREGLARNLVLAFPEGTVDSRGRRFWNATDACCDFDGAAVDDVAYLLRVIDEIAARTPIDAARVSLFGHSNGHFMAYRIACEHPERVAVVAGLAGAGSSCVPAAPVHVLHVHGTADAVINYRGGRFAAEYPGAEATVRAWAVADGCERDPSPAPGPPLDATGDLDGPDTTRLAWPCPAGRTVELWRIDGGDHGPELTGAFVANLVETIAGLRR